MQELDFSVQQIAGKETVIARCLVMVEEEKKWKHQRFEGEWIDLTRNEERCLFVVVVFAKSLGLR
jgi:hypothetical protein